jgi:alpha-N-arabinofuranosidase
MQVLCLTLGMTVTAGTTAQGWWEDFDLTQIPAKWRWIAPVEGPTYSLMERPGFLRVKIPQRDEGYDLWIGRDAAPRLLREVGEGDWELEASLSLAEFGKESNFHIALAAFPSEKFYIGWGIFQGYQIWGMEKPEVWLEYPGRGRILTAALDGYAATLAIRKRGVTYTFLLKRGDEWTEAGSISLPFPPRFVGLLFKTYGKGPGVVVDVDYIAFRPLPPQPREEPTVSITVHADRPQHEIHPYLYGHFIEHLGRCIYGGIWAERLYNRKFTGRADELGVVEGWKAIGADEDVIFTPDTQVYFAPAQSQRIEIRKEGRERGVQQDGLAVEAGKRYAIRVVLRGRDLTAPVRVALRHGDSIYAEHMVDVGPDWSRFTFELVPSQDDPSAQFSITTTGSGTLWLGAVSLMPADNVYGMRKDVLEAIKAIRPSVVRWPGGNFVSGYHWHDGIGDPDRRPPRWDRAWNAWEWNDFGTDEFIRFCREVGAEPYICANAGEGCAEEAAAWVEYCNGSPDSRYGRLRAANGHVEPYNVRIWGLGNEMYGHWQLGHLDPEKYAIKAVEMARAMRAASPIPLELIGVGVDADSWDGWNHRVVPLLAHEIEYYSVHYYRGVDVADAPETQYLVVLESLQDVERMLARTAEIISLRNKTGRPLPIAFDEWNVWMNISRAETGLEADYTLRDGLWACGIFHILHRLGDRVKMANLAQLVNVLGAIRTDQTRLAKTPLYYAFYLYANHFGSRFVPADVEQGVLTPRLKTVDVSAALSEDGRRLHLALVNFHPSEAVRVRWDLKGFEPDGLVEEVRMIGPNPMAANRLGRPEEVQVRKRRLTWEEVQAEPIPPHSASIWILERKR